MLRRDRAHSLTDGADRWPVIDGIAFLRVGRDAIRDEAIIALDRGDRAAGLRILLADQDDWWRGGTANASALDDLIAREASVTLREAMELLGWGPVGTYFANRWSDPTFIAGLALVEAHWNDPRIAFELACGIGHHLRELSRRQVSVIGADVVFAKLWIARHFIVPDAELVCFDAAEPWPLSDTSADLVCCHDAFYFLPRKSFVANALDDILHRDGVLAVSHIHNREWPNFSAGDAVDAQSIATLFPGSVVYDDAELTCAAVEVRAPRHAPPDRLRKAEAFSLVRSRDPAIAAPRRLDGRLTLPEAGASLVRNPLYDDEGILCFPSAGYAEEYGARATYRGRTDCPEHAVCDAKSRDWARTRELVDLPERW